MQTSLYQKIQVFFNSTNLDGKVIGVAVSGGRDSIALLYALKMLNKNIVAINIEHGIRGEESISDTNFVKDFCKKENIKLITFSVDAINFSKENGYTLEQGARFLRYDAFNKVLENGDADYIALAHHKMDQAETILMRIIRGTGVKGLIGMEKVSGKFIRPILDCTRDEIEDFVKENNLSFVEDSSNADLAFTRNYLRNELNSLKEKFPFILDSFNRLSRLAKEEEDYIESKVPELNIKNNEVFVPIKLEDYIFIRSIYKACSMLNVKQDIEEKHLEIINNLKTLENGKYVELTHGIKAHKDNEYIVITKCDCLSFKETEFALGEFKEFNIKVEEVNLSDVNFKDGNLYMDLDKIPDGTKIRNRLEKDVICKFGGGTKNLGDYLTDKKIPLRNRDNLTIIANENDVLCVVGVDISSKVKIDEKTKKVIKITKI